MQVKKIAEVLLTEDFVVDVNLKSGIKRVEYNGKSIVSKDIFLMTAKTKSLLFKNIDQRIRDLYPEKENLPEIYSIPIVHMDWEQSKQIQSDVMQV